MKGLAIAIAIVLGAALIVLLPVLPIYWHKPGPRPAVCLSNLHSLVVATSMYVLDYGQFPDAGRWMDELINGGYLTTSKVFHCPNDEAHRYSYAMNSALSGMKPPDPKNLPHVVLFFSSTSGKRNASGSPATACRPHKGEGDMCFIAYADGDAEALGPGHRPK